MTATPIAVARATLGELARSLRVSGTKLNRLLGRLYRSGNEALAYEKADGRALFDVEAVRLAVAPHLEALRAERPVPVPIRVEVVEPVTVDPAPPAQRPKRRWRRAPTPEVYVVRRSRP